LPRVSHRTGGNIEDSAKANVALARISPSCWFSPLLVLVIQVRSLSAMFMVSSQRRSGGWSRADFADLPPAFGRQYILDYSAFRILMRTR